METDSYSAFKCTMKAEGLSPLGTVVTFLLWKSVIKFDVPLIHSEEDFTLYGHQATEELAITTFFHWDKREHQVIVHGYTKRPEVFVKHGEAAECNHKIQVLKKPSSILCRAA